MSLDVWVQDIKFQRPVRARCVMCGLLNVIFKKKAEMKRSILLRRGGGSSVTGRDGARRSSEENVGPSLTEQSCITTT